MTDNAKAFKTASKEAGKIARSTKVIDYLRNKRVTWKFIVEKPLGGGFLGETHKNRKEEPEKALEGVT